MNLKGIVLVAIVLFANIGIINAEQISIPSISTPLGAKTTQLDRVPVSYTHLDVYKRQALP